MKTRRSPRNQDILWIVLRGGIMFTVWYWHKWDYQWLPEFYDRDSQTVYVYTNKKEAIRAASLHEPSPSGKPAEVRDWDSCPYPNAHIPMDGGTI